MLVLQRQLHMGQTQEIVQSASLRTGPIAILTRIMRSFFLSPKGETQWNTFDKIGLLTKQVQCFETRAVEDKPIDIKSFFVSCDG